MGIPEAWSLGRENRMTELLAPTVLYVAFALSALVELYFFMMQRSSLEISRAADMHPRDGRFMLPLWYILLWPTRLIKWGAAIAIAIMIHWGIALGLHLIRRVGLQYARSRSSERLANLLLVTTLAVAATWLAGLAAKAKGWARHYQANTVKSRAVLSVFFLGRRVLKSSRLTLQRADVWDAARELPLLVHRTAQFS